MLDDPSAGGGFEGTYAYGINDAGQIAGIYYDSSVRGGPSEIPPDV